MGVFLIHQIDLAVGRSVRRLGLRVEHLYRLLKLRRILAHPISYVRRRLCARRVLRDTAHRGVISRKTGYAPFAPKALPQTDSVVEACQRLFSERHGSDTSGAPKPFYANLLDEQDLLTKPEILEFALDDQIIEIVTDYLGTLPRLSALGLQYSPINETTVSSQMFHVDGDDFHQIKCFINVLDVGPEDGPLSFFPADTSKRVRAALRHGWRAGRLTDKEVFGECEEEELVAVTGPAGSGVLLDTSACLHFGSRARRRPRLTLMCQYAPCPNLETDLWRFEQEGSVLVRFPTERYADHPLKHAVLSELM